MENIIKQVIESEYKAQRIIAEAQEAAEKVNDSIESEILKIKEDIFLKASKKAEEVKAEKLRCAELQAEEVKSGACDKESLMRKKFEDNRDLWVGLLLDKVVNSSD